MNRTHATVEVECPSCDGHGEITTADLFVGDGYTRCLYCGGSGLIDVCENCYDDGTGEGCAECNPSLRQPSGEARR